MKNTFIYARQTFILIICFFFVSILSCQRPEIVIESDGVKTDANDHQNIKISEAKEWFNSLTFKNAREKAQYSRNPDWDQAFELDFKGGKAVVAPFKTSNADIPRIKKDNKENKKSLDKSELLLGEDLLSNLIIYKKDDNNVAEVVTMLPDDDFYKAKKKGEIRKKFTGYITVRNLDGEFIKGYSYVNGQVQGNISVGSPPSTPNGRPNLWQVCDQIDWYTTVCIGSDCDTHYDRTEDFYCWTSSGSGGGDSYLISTGSGSTGNSNGQSFAPSLLSLVGIDNEVIPKSRIECLTSNNTSAYTYKITLYVDQPVNGATTLFSPNDKLGHTFVGFEKTDANNTVVNRAVIGFYPATFAKGMESLVTPVDGVIKDNQTSPYDISYTISVTGSQFTTAVGTARDWDNQSYFASGYNCANAATDVFNSIGVNIPIGISKIMLGNIDGTNPMYVFVYSPGPLGEKLRAMKNNNPSLDINTGNNSPAPANVNLCN